MNYKSKKKNQNEIDQKGNINIETNLKIVSKSAKT
jgi:hypothetical protein